MAQKQVTESEKKPSEKTSIPLPVNPSEKEDTNKSSLPDIPEPSFWNQERSRHLERFKRLNDQEIRLRGVILQAEEELSAIQKELAALRAGIDMGDMAIRTYIELLREDQAASIQT